MIFASLIRGDCTVRVDTTDVTEKSESVNEQQPKAEALTLLVHRKVPVRPIKVIERSDDVVVIHTNKRTKRKPSTRGRRRPTNSFRSKIRSPGGTSNFGGFSTNDRFPSFPSKKFNEPVRASNKLKYGPPSNRATGPSYDFNSQPRRPPKRSQQSAPPQIYGPPPSSFNHIESEFNQPITLQQQQHSFPSFSINAVEPAAPQNFYGNNEITKFSTPIRDFPLGDGSTFGPKTSYGEPIRSASTNQGTNSYQFNSNLQNILNQVKQQQQQQLQNQQQQLSQQNNFPKLPSRYEQNEFSTPTRHNPLNSNSFPTDFTGFDLSESQNILSTPVRNNNNNNINFNNNKNRFNKFNNYDYDFGKNRATPTTGFGEESLKNRPTSYDDDEDDDDEEDLEYLIPSRRPVLRTTTTTTTQAPFTTRKTKKGVFGNRKRKPTKVSQSHNLDTDDLRDAFTGESNNDFHEVALSSDDFLNFDSQRNNRRHQQNQENYPDTKNQNYPILSKSFLGSSKNQQSFTDVIKNSQSFQDGNKNPKNFAEIHSTLKAARKNSALRTALGDDFQIVSIQKSLEKDPKSASGLNFLRGDDGEEDYKEFKVGSEINFSEAPTWSGDMTAFPRNHRYS